MTRFAMGLAAVLAMAGSARANLVISEWMYQGANTEFIEFTNIGNAPVDMTGWSFDDDSRIAGTVSLSAFGIVGPGESVILAEGAAPDFIAAWGLSGVSVIGGNTTNLGRNDEINLYDASNALVDRLTYGDQVFIGSIRTQNFSGNPLTPAVLGANDVFQWVLASSGDAYGSYASTGGDIGNPGIYIPEPASMGLLALGAVALLRRRR